MIPIKLYMENFISHIKSEIDFTKFDAAIIIGAIDGNPKIANGVGKCLPGDTKIYDSNLNEIVTIERFVLEKRISTLGLVDGKLTSVKVNNWFVNGIKPIIKILCSDGSSISVSETHPILTPNGCVEAKNIKIGDFVAQIGVLPINGKILFTKEENFLLGLLLNNLISNKDITSIFFKDIEKKQNINLFFYKKIYKEFLKKINIKSILEKILIMDNESILNLLSGLWLINGCIHENEVFYLVEDEKLAQSLKRLLLRLGILSLIRRGNKKYYTVYILADHIINFFEKMKLFKEIDEYSKHSYGLSRKDFLKFSNSIKIDSDIFWTKVTDKINELPKKCYDLNIVSDEHLFIADTFITHNSSIFDAIRFALYGKVRFNKKEKVIRRGETICKVICIFSIDDRVFKVERTINKSSGFIDVIFSKMDGHEWNNEGYTCDTSTATTAKIESIIGMSHDTFVNCIYYRQNDLAGFAGAKSNKRKETLKEILQIGFWDELQEIAKKYEKDLSVQKLLVTDRLENFEDIEKQYNNVKIEFKETKQQLADFKSNIIKIENDLKDNDKKINKIEAFILKKPNKLELNKKLEKNSEKIIEIKNNRDKIKKSVQKNNEEICNAQNDFRLLDIKLLELAKVVLIIEHNKRYKAETIFRKSCNKSMPEVSFTMNDLFLKKNEYNEFSRKLDFLNSQLHDLTILEPGKECPICLSKIENPEDIVIRRKTRFNYLKKQRTEIEQKLLEIGNIITKWENLIIKANEAIVEIERTELIIAKRMATITNLGEKNNNLREKFSILANEWEKLKDEKIEIKSLISTFANLDFYQDELSKSIEKRESLNECINVLRENIINHSIKLGHLESSLNELEVKLSEKQTLLVRKSHLIDEINVYSEISRAFGKDGIQAIIMENITEDLRNYANSVLKCICIEPMSIDFITQRETNLGVWKEDFNISIIIGNNKMDFDDLSGGEQVRISIALRLALSRLLMQRVGNNVKFLLLDEVDQTLDEQGVEALVETILALSNEFKIMLITHNDIMKEKFEHVITVFKGPSGSIITQ